MIQPQVIDSYKDTTREIRRAGRTGWAIAKPFNSASFITRVYHAWLVFNDKATAVIFEEDNTK